MSFALVFKLSLLFTKDSWKLLKNQGYSYEHMNKPQFSCFIGVYFAQSLRFAGFPFFHYTY